MSDPCIKDAIKTLIDDKKSILIRNAIATLKLRLSEACEYDDFYRIDYDKYAKQIIDESNAFMRPERKEEINNQELNDERPTPNPINIRSSDPNLVDKHSGHINDLIQNPIIWRKTILCTVCKQPIEDDYVIYISSHPYHFGCIKCMNCHKSYDITPGLFLCRQHYDDYQTSNQLSTENFREYHKRNKENFVNDLFNEPLQNEIVFDDEQDENALITPDLVEDVIPLNTEIEDFVPTVTFRFDKMPTEIDFSELEKFIGEEIVILGVQKGSTILKIAFLSIKTFGQQIHGKIKELVEKFKGKLKTSIGKSVVGNLIEEPYIKLPDDNIINEKYNKKSQNLLQNTHELDSIELKTIKEEVLGNLHKEKVKKNWSFIFEHSNIYERLETQIRDDIKNSPFELIIIGQTIIANKNIKNYSSIEEKIPKYNQRQPFLYHGTNQSNHQKIINKHFLMPGQDKIEKKTDSGYYGKGIYATNDIFYASKYANSYADLDFNSKAYVICCMTIYNSNFCNDIKDKSYLGKKIDKRIEANYGIHHALVGNSTSFWPIEESQKDSNYIAAEEFVFPNKGQIIPLYSFTVMRTDHFILFKNENIENKENKMYFNDLSKKMQVNVYKAKSVDEALKIIVKKKRNMFKLITNGGGPQKTGETLIKEARKIIGSNFICFVFARDTRHYEWVKKMENVLFSTSEDDLKKFCELELKEDKIVEFTLYLEYKSEFVFDLNRSQMLNFPTTNRSYYK